MKLCIICEAETKDNEFCANCLNFLKWKYETNFEEKLERFRKVKSYLDEWREQSTEKEVKE